MNMLETILNHRSIRKYSNKPIEKEILNEILIAGSRASNTGNMQIYSIIVTKDKELKKQLWETHFKQDMVLQAPVVLTFCADINRFNKWCKHRQAKPGYDNFLWFCNGVIDSILASQNVVIAAEEYQLGICYLGTTTYNADKIIKILNIPKYVVPVTTVVLGYPEENPELTDRLPIDGILHHDVYNDYTNDDIDRIYEAKEALASTHNLIKENKTANLARVFTEKRYTKEDNLFFSKKYLEVVKKQGFMNNDVSVE